LIVISLLTDFGIADPYVAQMKAVILSSSPSATIIDISHGIEKHNIAMGAHMLKTTVPWFPPGSIHVAVVDPGVGSSRLPIAIDCERGVLIGPDNGLLVGAADVLGFRGAYRIANPEFANEIVSSTFHGRDVFARTAAMMSEGRRPTEVGSRLDKLVQLDLPSVSTSQEYVSCHIVYVDSFGNLVTDVTRNELQVFKQRKSKTAVLFSKGRKFEVSFVESYSDIPRGELGLLLGSQGHLEIAQREASAAARLNLRVGDSIQIRFR
jgi:S-adenosyl-L-methionine hydrolase (adenosine-forming)